MLGTTGGKFWAAEFAVRWCSAVRTRHRCAIRDHRWRHDGEESGDASALRQHPPSAATPPWSICPFGRSAPASSQLATLSALIIRVWGDYWGSTARGLGFECHHCRWGRGRSKGWELSSSGSLTLEVPTELPFLTDFVCNNPQDLWPKQGLKDHTSYLRMLDSGHVGASPGLCQRWKSGAQI